MSQLVPDKFQVEHTISSDLKEAIIGVSVAYALVKIAQIVLK